MNQKHQIDMAVSFPAVRFEEDQLFSLELFRQLDYWAVEKYYLPIELMMENAGWQLSRLVMAVYTEPCDVYIGIGKGNNGGGGLVAARRLLARGYRVWLDLPDEALSGLPAIQLERSLQFGAKKGVPPKPAILVDAWLGFSQRLPLPDTLNEKIKHCNQLLIPRIALDIPTGFHPQSKDNYFKADLICCLAAPKKILAHLLTNSRIFIADLGIPDQIYMENNISYHFPKNNAGLFEWTS